MDKENQKIGQNIDTFECFALFKTNQQPQMKTSTGASDTVDTNSLGIVQELPWYHWVPACPDFDKRDKPASAIVRQKVVQVRKVVPSGKTQTLGRPTWRASGTSLSCAVSQQSRPLCSLQDPYTTCSRTSLCCYNVEGGL